MRIEPFKLREKQYRFWQAQASARELLCRLEALEHDRLELFPDEIASVRSVLTRLNAEQDVVLHMLKSQGEGNEQTNKRTP